MHELPSTLVPLVVGIVEWTDPDSLLAQIRTQDELEKEQVVCGTLTESTGENKAH